MTYKMGELTVSEALDHGRGYGLTRDKIRHRDLSFEWSYDLDLFVDAQKSIVWLGKEE